MPKIFYMQIYLFMVFKASVMDNISFRANLIVDDSLYKKMPKGTPNGYTDNLVKDYKKFIDHKVIKEVTEGDTIEIYKAPYTKGFAIGMRFLSDKLDEPLETGIYTNKKIPDVKSSSLVFQTLLFLKIKSKIKDNHFESHIKSFKRAITALRESEQNNF